MSGLVTHPHQFKRKVVVKGREKRFIHVKCSSKRERKAFSAHLMGTDMSFRFK
jgi:hypothetical protein